MSEIGDFALPVMIFLIVAYGLAVGIPVFDVFLAGAKEGLKTMVTVLPTLVGLITAVTMFQASGAMDLLNGPVAPVASLLGLPVEVIPLMLIHPVSGGGATAILTDIFERFGPDSIVGRIASVMCGSGETTLYAVTVYYGSVGVRSIGHTLPVALLADFAVAVLSGIAVHLFM